MKTKEKNRTGIECPNTGKLITMALLLAMMIACSSDNSNISTPSSKGKVTGTVKDENGNSYPNTEVGLSNQSGQEMTKTNSQGNFEFNNKEAGSYNVNISPPLSTIVVSQDPLNINIQADQTSTASIVIQPQPLVAHLNFEDVDVFGEIKDKDSNTPTDPNELLYAANIFDAPLGLLTAIKAPDNHHVTLSEWKSAVGGTVTVNCKANTAIVNIALQGMIPNGTYTFWLNFLNKIKKPGESMNPPNDIVKIEPLRSGTENIAIAEADGTINISIEHTSCILTEETALVMPIVYHINGNTFGSAHIPDPEEVTHMLVYFQ